MRGHVLSQRGAAAAGQRRTDNREPAFEAAEVARLARQLRREIAGEIQEDAASRLLYGSDASNYRVVPALVVAPRSRQDLLTTLALSSAARIPVTMRGAGTSVAGNACGAGVVIDTSRHLASVRAVDPATRTALVEPGVILDDLNRRAAEHGLRLGPDPSTHSRCTVGGMIGNNACGSHSVRWGTTAQNVRALEVALADGTVRAIGPAQADAPGGMASAPARGDDLRRRLWDLMQSEERSLRTELTPWARRVSGYGLDWLLPERGFDVAKALVGSEGTCAVVLAATLDLVESPRSTALLVVGFPDDVTAAEAAPMLAPEAPLTVECITAELLGPAAAGPLGALLPAGRAWLMVESAGDTPGAAREHAGRLAATLGLSSNHLRARVHTDAAAQAALWRVREEGAGRATRLPDDSPAWPGLEDVAVPPARLAHYLAAFHMLLAQHELRGTTYGHFGEGCVHVRIGFDFRSAGGVGRFRRFMTAAADLVLEHGGSLSGEHGDGRARGALLPRMFSPEIMAAFRRFRSIWDPSGMLNPGIIDAPDPIDERLRPAARTAMEIVPVLAYRADRGDLRTAVERCVGVGKCVARSTSDLMCPSYRVTAAERDSTRGRARLLQEMVSGDLASRGWRSTEVRDALDLCLSCKGCLSDCPTGVDMATYKSEFLDHHYRHRVRPRSHYSLGWLPLWLRLASHRPALANRILRSRSGSHVLKAVGGIDPRRTLPRLPPRTFIASFSARGVPPAGPRGTVIMWPDTWNNHLTPHVADAAVSVLAAAGFGVEIPRQIVCCGLTWITTGQLDHARRVALKTVAAIGTGDEPVVVLEPSCAAALKEDLPSLLPHEPRVVRLAERVRTFAEILDSVGFGVESAATIPAVVQPHCHQQAQLGIASDRRVLERCGIEVTEMITGCCGLAGDFGMETSHREVSQAVAGLSLLPALSRASNETVVVADGFSCRTQIESLGTRRAIHTAELLARRLQGSPE